MTDTYEPRRARPGETFEYAGPDGQLRTFKADGKGLLRPKDADQAAIADSRELPVARVTPRTKKAAPKAAATDEKTDAGDGGNEKER